MANVPGPQPDIKYCPVCKSDLINVPRSKMKSIGYVRKDGTVSKHTHTYDCAKCKNDGLVKSQSVIFFNNSDKKLLFLL
jgi:uncharacterized protein with PIN domain